MKVEIVTENKNKVFVADFGDGFSRPISEQLSISCDRFLRSINDGDSFMVVCSDNRGLSTLVCGYHVDTELRTINIPFVFSKREAPPLIRGRSMIMAINAFLRITHEYSNYSFFATATPKARRVIEKLISPPFELVGVMENYFIYETHNEDAFLYWLPSIKQSRKIDVRRA